MHQNNLKNKLNEILPFIKDKNEVIFLDYPVYLNVGDLLIYHGTENFFKEITLMLNFGEAMLVIQLRK